MKRMAIIENGVVTNIAAWDGVTPWNPGQVVDVTDLVNADGDQVQVGHTTTDNVIFTAPTEET